MSRPPGKCDKPCENRQMCKWKMGRNGDTIEFEKVCAKRTDKGLDLYDDKDFAHLPQLNEKKIKKKAGKRPRSSSLVSTASLGRVSKKVTPMSKSVTPVSKKITPMSKSVTPVSKKITPMSKSVTPIPKRVTPVNPFDGWLDGLIDQVGGALAASPGKTPKSPTPGGSSTHPGKTPKSPTPGASSTHSPGDSRASLSPHGESQPADSESESVGVPKWDWTFKQGELGINAEAREYLKHQNAITEFQCGEDRTVRQPYQDNIRLLTTPHTPFKRMLVAWSMGLGKTRAILDVLDNYYSDPRPKLFLSPNEALAIQFYTQLLDPNARTSYQDWLYSVERELTTECQNALRSNPEKVRVTDIKSALERRNRGATGLVDMRGDIRSLTFASASKGCRENKEMGVLWSAKAVARRVEGIRECLRREGKADTGSIKLKGLDGCIIVVDEAHLLVQAGDKETPKDYLAKKKHAAYVTLRKALAEAENSVVVLFTGTPMSTPVKTGHHVVPGSLNRLLGIVAGRDKDGKSMGTDDVIVKDMIQGNMCYEGYVSYFMDRTVPALFATTIPSLSSMGTLPVNVVEVRMHADFAEEYAKIRFKGLKGGALPSSCVEKGHNAASRIHNSCKPLSIPREAMSNVYYRHDLLNRKITNLERAIRFSPKIGHVVQDILRRNSELTKEKTVIMIYEKNGIKTLEHTLKLVGISVVCLEPAKGTKTVRQKIQKANSVKIQKFNDRTNNLRGQTIQVLVAPEEYNEGMNIYDAKRMILMDQTDDSSAGTLALMRQRVARALRLCGHHSNNGLDENERVLTCDLYVVNWDKDRMVETIDMEKLRILKEEMNAEDNTEETKLWGMSIDGATYTRNVSPSAAPPLIVSPSEGVVMQALHKVATALREFVHPAYPKASHT
jgi:hypothetical protein